MDVEPNHHPAEAIRHQPVRAVLHQRDAAGLEIGGVDRVVDVLVGVEIAEADVVAEAKGEVLQARRRIEAAWCVHRLISVISVLVTSQLF